MPLPAVLPAEMTVEEELSSLRPPLVLSLAVAVGALGWMYWLVLPGLVRQWWNEDEYSHGFIVPLIAGVLVWSKWDDVRRLPLRAAYGGLPVMVLSLVFYATGIIGADLFLQRVSMVMMIAGGLLFVAGWRVTWCLAFPLAYLLLMIPLPGIIFNSVAFPLQLLAAEIATDTMHVLAVPVYREGNVIHLAQASLDVEEACSGIRSLISLIAIGVPFAYLMERQAWRRAAVIVMVVPIAIAANVGRVTGTGLLAHYVSVDFALGVFHTVGGLSVFVAGTAMLLLFSLLLRRTLGPR